MKRGQGARLTPVEVGRDSAEHMSTPRENVVPYAQFFEVIRQTMPPSTTYNISTMSEGGSGIRMWKMTYFSKFFKSGSVLPFE